MRCGSQKALQAAESHKIGAMRAAYDDREAERVQFLEHAKLMVEQAGASFAVTPVC